MAQRIFDVDNPQDVEVLFNILPNNIVTIKWLPNDTVGLVDNRGLMTSTELFCIVWHDKTVITRPADESKWIGCLCWFWDRDPNYKILGFLKKIDRDYFCPYEEVSGSCYKYCRPVRRDEVKFVEDME